MRFSPCEMLAENIISWKLTVCCLFSTSTNTHRPYLSGGSEGSSGLQYSCQLIFEGTTALDDTLYNFEVTSKRITLTTSMSSSIWLEGQLSYNCNSNSTFLSLSVHLCLSIIIIIRFYIHSAVIEHKVLFTAQWESGWTPVVFLKNEGRSEVSV